VSAPQLLSEKCGTCIFRPGNPMRLRAGRVKDMVNRALADGGSIICHDSLVHREDDDGAEAARSYREGEAMCRGFYDAHGHRSYWVRIVERLGGFEEVPPPSP
jgi:hypothetical protein